MKTTTVSLIALLAAGSVLTALAQTPPPPAQAPPGQPGSGRGGRGGGPQPMPPGPNPNSQYRLGPDSMQQEGVPKGEIHGPGNTIFRQRAGQQCFILLGKKAAMKILRERNLDKPLRKTYD